MKKLISGIFLVTGTSIGGGMVMLPAVVGVYGYFSAIGLLIGVWIFNTLIALLFLEANCYLTMNTNLISMTKRLLGYHVQWVTWIIFLGFLYTIMCVYISGLTEVIGGFLEKNEFYIPSFYISFFAVFAVSLPIYLGIVYVNYFNRLLVIAMFLAFLALILLIAPHIEINNLLKTPENFSIMALPVVFTSFGFLVVIPRLRSYLDDDIKKIKIAIILGSFIPLVIYITWITVVMGVVPVSGSKGLQAILDYVEPVKGITKILATQTTSPSTSFFIQVFILFSIVSSFVGISLGLYDFLADGFRISKRAYGKIKLLSLTFLPPLIITLTPQ